MAEFRNEQEAFWAGEFGTHYSFRNSGLEYQDQNVTFFNRILHDVSGEISTVLELGANIGLNYLALREVISNIKFTGVEINKDAFGALAQTGCEAKFGSLLDYRHESHCDLTFTKGVLIHINPKDLPSAYESLYLNSKKYVLIAEYYNPTPIEVTYRGCPRSYLSEILLVSF